MLAVHPAGEQPVLEPAAPVTTMGQLAFFIEYLKQGSLFDGWIAGCRCT